ncbi:MAG: hypothetical protein WD314_06895 [Trueperaceae bacterium]
MSQWGVRRFVAERRRIAIVLAVLLLSVLTWWLLAADPWPFAPERESLAQRLDAGKTALVDHRQRIEARLRLQELEAAIADGRRSAALRPSYRLIEEKLESVLAREEPEIRAALRTEMTELLPDLTRNRGAARARIERLIAALQSSSGPGRQGQAK